MLHFPTCSICCSSESSKSTIIHSDEILDVHSRTIKFISIISLILHVLLNVAFLIVFYFLFYQYRDSELHQHQNTLSLVLLLLQIGMSLFLHAESFRFSFSKKVENCKLPELLPLLCVFSFLSTFSSLIGVFVKDILSIVLLGWCLVEVAWSFLIFTLLNRMCQCNMHQDKRMESFRLMATTADTKGSYKTSSPWKEILA